MNKSDELRQQISRPGIRVPEIANRTVYEDENDSVSSSSSLSSDSSTIASCSLSTNAVDMTIGFVSSDICKVNSIVVVNWVNGL